MRLPFPLHLRSSWELCAVPPALNHFLICDFNIFLFLISINFSLLNANAFANAHTAHEREKIEYTRRAVPRHFRGNRIRFQVCGRFHRISQINNCDGTSAPHPKLNTVLELIFWCRFGLSRPYAVWLEAYWNYTHTAVNITLTGVEHGLSKSGCLVRDIWRNSSWILGSTTRFCWFPTKNLTRNTFRWPLDSDESTKTEPTSCAAWTSLKICFCFRK